MSARVCGRCRRPLPVPATEGSAPTSCPFCFAHLEGARAPAGAQAAAGTRPAPPRSASSLPPARGADGREESPGKKRAEAFASALAENAGRTTPVHSFAVPPEAIPLVNTPRRRASTPRPPQAPAPPPPVQAPPVQVAPPPPVQMTPAPIYVTPQAPPRRAAVTATLASLGPSTASAASAYSATVFRSSDPVPAPVAATLLAMSPVVAPAPVLAHHAAPVLAHHAAPAVAHHAAPVVAYHHAAPPAVVAMPPVVVAPVAAPAANVASHEPLAEVAPAADAWNIGPYLGGGDGTPSSEAVPDPQPHMASEPIDFEVRGPIASFIHRLPGRGLGAALGSALVVVVLGAGGFKLFGGALRSHASHPAGTAVTPAPEATPATPTPLPTLIMPSAAATPPHAPAPPSPAPKAERPSPPEPRVAPPAVEEEAPAARSSTRTHARHEKVAKPRPQRAQHHASPSPARSGSHRRVVARASKSERGDAAESESDKMARARAAYREGNEHLFSGDGAGAIAAYEEMVRLNPKDPAGYRGLGLASAHLGKRTEAVRYLRAYLKHAPNAEDRAIISGRISLLQTLP